MLTYQELTTTIIDYLKSSETEYAIMINGKWGCGKTYYSILIITSKNKSNHNYFTSLKYDRIINFISIN